MHFSIPETETRAGDGGAPAYVVSGAEGAELSRRTEPPRGAEWAARLLGPGALRPRWGRAGPQPRRGGGSGSAPGAGPGPGPGEASRSRPAAIPGRRPVPGPSRDRAPPAPRLGIGRGRSRSSPGASGPCPARCRGRGRAARGAPSGLMPSSGSSWPARPSVCPGFLFWSLRRARLRSGAGTRPPGGGGSRVPRALPGTGRAPGPGGGSGSLLSGGGWAALGSSTHACCPCRNPSPGLPRDPAVGQPVPV